MIQIPSLLIRPRRRDPTAHRLHPFWCAATLLVFDFGDISVTPTPTSHPVLLLLVPSGPVVVLFEPCLLVFRCHLKVGFTRQLASRSICWTMLNRRMSVSEITEVVDILSRK